MEQLAWSDNKHEESKIDNDIQKESNKKLVNNIFWSDNDGITEKNENYAENINKKQKDNNLIVNNEENTVDTNENEFIITKDKTDLMVMDEKEKYDNTIIDEENKIDSHIQTESNEKAVNVEDVTKSEQHNTEIESKQATNTIETTIDEEIITVLSEKELINEYRKRITNIYRSYNPEKMNKVDVWLKKYKNNPHELYTKICNTYKISPKPKILCDVKTVDITNDNQIEMKQEIISTSNESKIETDYFAICSKKYIIIENKTTVKLKSNAGYGTCYGALQFDCNSNLVHKWIFNISKSHHGAMAIGIDDSNGKYIEEFPFGKTDSNNYCYWSRGQKQSMRETISYNEKWNFKDKILMIFNAVNNTLSFKTETSTLTKAFDVKISQNKYMICVYMEGGNYSGKGDLISLMSYSCSQSEHIEEKTDNKSLNDDNTNKNAIQSLLLMGFDKDICYEAVNKFNNNLNSCVDYIVSHLNENKNIKSIQNIQKTKPTTVIENGEYFKYFIEPTAITKDNVEIRLILNKPIESRISYYIYECGKQKGEPVAEFLLKKGVMEDFEDLDLDEIDDTRLFNIALYENEHDKKHISNILKISMPAADNDDIDDDYKPDPIDISTVKAIEIDDEKEENIYIYFEIPNTLQGDEIAFKIKYVNNDSKKEEKYISSLLILPKILIPISFQIITSSTIDNVEYLSNPSEIITVDYTNETLKMLTSINEKYTETKIEVKDDKEQKVDMDCITNTKMNEKVNESNMEDTTAYLETFQQLLSMGFEETISLEAAKKFKQNINRCLEFISQQDANNKRSV